MTARRLLADDTGATAIEYALLAGFIATVIIGAVASLGHRARQLLRRREYETDDRDRGRRDGLAEVHTRFGKLCLGNREQHENKSKHNSFD